MRKRNLTEKEIEYILDFIVPRKDVPQTAEMEIVKNNKNRLKKQLENVLIYEEIIPELKKQIKTDYFNTLIQPGESIGIICAQSIGEKQTQMTLNTFHKAGQSEKAMTAGVPRFQELLNATKDPKIINCKIFLNETINDINKVRNFIGNNLKEIKLQDIITDFTIYLDKEEEKWYNAFSIMYNNDFRKYKECISFKINKEILYRYKINYSDIYNYFNENYNDLFCVISPPQFCQIDIFVDTENIVLPENRITYIDESNYKEVYLEECVLPNLLSTTICGIPGINEIYFTKEDDEYIVETDGSNLLEIFCNDKFDYTKTFSNNVWDIYELLGIEAARQFLLEEFMSIMQGINVCHTQVLVNRMTHSGSISSISRYTLRKAESGPFGKASFEETMDNFLNAAANGDIEPTRGVSASIICGKRAEIGTGGINIKIDIDNLPE